MRTKRQMIGILIVAMIIQLISFPGFAETDQSNLAEVGYIGPGKYSADIIIVDGGNPEDDFSIGMMSMWNTRNRLWMKLDTNPDWVIRDVMIYVGEEEPPMKMGGAPDLQAYPFQETLAEPGHTYEFSLDLLKDMELTWGRKDEARRIPKVSICLHVEAVGELGQGGMRYAWAKGNVEFNGRDGWWMNYAIVHPSVGHFIDAPVKGLGYRTPTHTGTTDNGGSFNYFPGETVEFYIGGVSIGAAKGDHKVTPMDLIGTADMEDSRVVNMAKMLQSLDDDGEPNGGIDIGLATSMAFSRTSNEMGIESVDYADNDQVVSLIEGTNQKVGGRLNPVDDLEALDHLEKGTSSNMVRKNVSKNSAFEDAKAKLEMMSVYVPAMKANGTPVMLNYYDLVTDEETGEQEQVLKEQRNLAKPLVTVYTEEVPGTDGSDVYGAISRDAGETWQIKNLSKSADKSSMIVNDGDEYPGTVKKPQVRVKDNYILVAWTSKFARTGSPRYALDPGDPYYQEDLFGVGGPQRSRDYTDEGWPEVGELPYSAVWTCRGVIDEASGEIIWYKPERLTSGRRDAYQLMMNGVPDAGFALVWQEDPEGLRPGECAGPGDGWSGATTSHKTDIWYSYINWDDFTQIDYDFESNGVIKSEELNEDQKGRPRAEVPFSLPVRISDNDTLNLESMRVDMEQISGLDSLAVGKSMNVDAGSFVPLLDDDKLKGTHNYGYLDLPDYYYKNGGPEICDRVYHKVNHQGADKYVAVTEDGRILDGNTGASRPNIMMQKYTAKDKDGNPVTKAWVVICYEETKGVGSGPDEETSDGGSGSGNALPDEEDNTEGDPTEENPTEEDLIVDQTADLDSNLPDDIPDQGVGEQKGKDAFVPDNGKLVVYHTFSMEKPDLISAGEIMNPQVLVDSPDKEAYYRWEDGTIPGLDPETNLLYLVDENGDLLLDFANQRIPAYENARRPRLIIQGASGALGKSSSTSPAKWDVGTPLVMVFKMGEDGKGRPSDIMMRRWEIPSNFGTINKNPYDTVFLTDTIMNISSTTPTLLMQNDQGTDKRSGDGIKVMEWEQGEDCLDDSTFLNPYEDARAHRGIIRGKQLAIAYDWTPNWAASRNGNAVYNVYLRRSFDGGLTFTNNPNGNNEVYIDGQLMGVGTKTTEIFRTSLGSGNERIDEDEIPKVIVETFIPKGTYEPARNLSLMQNNKTTVIEPRLVGGPSTIKINGSTMFAEDKRNINRFWVTYGTCTNPGKNSTEKKTPLDLYYSYTDDFGDSFYEETKLVNPDSQGHYAGQERTAWPWLAKDTGKVTMEQAECQIRMSPDGKVFYSVWNENGNGGGDVKFRRIMLGNKMIESDLELVDVTPPFITIQGIEDGDVRSEDVTLEIWLNELGSWEATLKEGVNETIFTENPIEIAASSSSKAYVLDVVATDLSGNVGVRQIAFTIDGDVPQIEILGIENGEHTSQDVYLEINTFDAQETTVELLWNDTPMPERLSYDLDAEGRYALTVTASSDGHTAERRMSFVIDKTPPVIRIDGIEDGTVYTNSADPHVVVTDNYSTHLDELTLLLNGEEFLNSTKITEDGTYTLDVVAVDQAGNRAEASVTFTVEVVGSRYHYRVMNPSAVEGKIAAGEEATILFDTDFATLHVPADEFEEEVSYRIEPITDTQTFSGSGVRIGGMIYEIEFFTKDGDSIQSFDLPMTLTFEYEEENLPIGVSESELQVSYWNDDLSEWIVVPSTLDVDNNRIVADISHLSVFGVRAMKDFPCLEDCSNHWAIHYIYKLASLGIVSGDDSGNYHPDDPITREEMAKVLVNALGLESTGQVSAADASQVSNWAKEYMRIALATGALQLDENGMAYPKRNATREDLIVAASQVFGLKILSVKPVAFSDLETLPLNLHQTAQVMSQHGIMTGYEDLSIRPSSSISRGELAKMIAQVLRAQRR